MAPLTSSESRRESLSSISISAVLTALLLFDVLLLIVGLRQFEKKAVS